MAQPPATVTVNVSTLSNALAVAIQQAAVTSGRDQSASASATIGTRVTRRSPVLQAAQVQMHKTRRKLWSL